MLIKKFKSRKESELFKKQYSNGDISTEVISNILQPFNIEKFPEIKDYMDFLWNDSITSRTLVALNMFTESFSLDILKSLYGKHDFTFKGNRTYKNYVFEFNGLIFITPSKREVVISEKDLKLHIPTIIEFEKQFQQLIFEYALSDIKNLPDYVQEDVSKLKAKGVISEDNKINFDYFKPTKLPKIKL